MKVLWIVNGIFPVLKNLVTTSLFNSNNINISGSWMYSLAEAIKSLNIELHIVSVYNGRKYQNHEIARIHYHLLPYKGNEYKYHSSLEAHWDSLSKNISPDVIHIHGTEFPHALSFLKNHDRKNVLFSIQGLVSVIPRYYFSGISLKDILQNYTIRNIVFRDGIIEQKKMFYRRGKNEKLLFSKVKNVIGRTQWDYIHSHAISSNIDYFHINEMLRSDFYTVDKWDLDSCQRCSIFISQGSYPIKGLHMAIKALAIIKKTIPNIQLNIAGKDMIKTNTLYNRLAFTGYSKYIKQLVKTNNLKNNIKFLGNLTEKEMILQYKKSHLFLCASSIENSSNSVCEAQILGVPVVASNVGGIEDLLENNISGILYRFEEYESLASIVVNLMSDDGKCLFLSKNAIEIATVRHNRTVILEKILATYKQISLL